MALETATYVANLVVTNPDDSDAVNAGDDHIRLIKAVLRRTFPNLDGAVSLSSQQVSYVGDLSASVQLQLNTLRDGSATANFAKFANSASFAASASSALLALTANSASYAALAGRAESASFATFAGHAQSASFATNATNATAALTANSASYATLAGTASTALFSTTCTSASSAALLAGVAGDAAATASTVALRNNSGYLFAQYFNHGAAAESPSVGHVVVVTNNDGYFRVSPIANVGAYLEARNITGRSGTTKTLSTSTPSGGSNGDIWYRYS